MSETRTAPAWDLPPGGIVPPQEADRLYQQFRARLLDEVYPLPTLETEAGVSRLLHADLTGMRTDELSEERRRLTARLALDCRPEPWLLERRAALERARAAGAKAGEKQHAGRTRP